MVVVSHQECLSQLNATGQWEACCSAINIVLSFYSYLDPGTSERVSALQKELQISFDKYTEKVTIDAPLLPLPVFFAIRFIDASAETAESWVVCRMDSSSFQSHYAQLR